MLASADLLLCLLCSGDAQGAAANAHNASERRKSRAELVADAIANFEVSADAGELTPEQLKRYIAYCRTMCAPRLDDEAAKALQNHYVAIRSTVRAREVEGSTAVIPITVRQLEAICRISEALAKMEVQHTKCIRQYGFRIICSLLLLVLFFVFVVICNGDEASRGRSHSIVQSIDLRGVAIRARCYGSKKKNPQKNVKEEIHFLILS